MNNFQAQLVLVDGKTLAEKDGRFVPPAPRPCSIEEFERDMSEARSRKEKTDAR